jgi:hypothetical protein
MLFSFVTYGKGGWDWQTVYNLPVGLRNMYWKLLIDSLKKEQDAYNKNKPKKKPLAKSPGI